MYYRDLARQKAREAGISEDLFLRLVGQESGWNPNAVSPVGARGLTQVMPATGRDPGYGVAPLGEGNEDNLRVGAQYLKAMIDEYDGDVERALVAYNWGPGNANQWDGNRASLPEETRKYVGIVGDGGTDAFVGRSGPMRFPGAGLNTPEQKAEFEYQEPKVVKGLHRKIFDFAGGDEQAAGRMAGLGKALAGIGANMMRV